MDTKTLNGILCVHDIPVDESWEINYGVLFLHNERAPVGELVRDFAKHEKVAISYFVSDQRQEERDAVESLVMATYGGPLGIDISSSSHPYSEVTPDLCWTHRNEFKIGGHDMNRELAAHVGKWILIRLSRPQ